MTTATPIDPFADADKRPALSFKDKPIGTTYTCTIAGPASMAQQRDYDTEELATWPDGNPKMAAVVPITVDGEGRSIWAGKPSAMFRALADAQKAAGKAFEEGGTLIVRHERSEPNKNPKKADQKIYVAKYTPPAAAPAGDPFADDSNPPF